MIIHKSWSPPRFWKCDSSIWNTYCSSDVHIRYPKRHSLPPHMHTREYAHTHSEISLAKLCTHPIKYTLLRTRSYNFFPHDSINVMNYIRTSLSHLPFKVWLPLSALSNILHISYIRVYVEVVWVAGERLDGPISFCLPYPDYFYTPPALWIYLILKPALSRKIAWE